MNTATRFRSATLASFVCLAALAAGCVAPTSASTEDPTGTTVQEMAVSCYSPSVTPRPGCLPDLYIPYATSEQYAPGNAEDLAPGTYITFEISNKGAVAVGAFEVEIVDYYGNVLKTTEVPSLAVGGYYSVSIVAPYADGWTRTAIIDPKDTFAELSKSNNSFTVQTGLIGTFP